MKPVYLALVLLLYSNSQATTFYVRPGQHGTYGSGGGASYNNAFDGITGITWGGSGVNPGDTIYVCGTNIYTTTGANQFYATGVSKIGTNNITIRGDYGPDPLTHFGGALIGHITFYWQGPDANGVYYTTNSYVDGAYRELRYQIDPGSIQFLPVKGAVTWTGGSAGCAFIGGTNFVHTISGNAPSNNIATRIGGWVWDLNSHPTNTFNGGTYISDTWQKSGNGWWQKNQGMVWLNLTVQHNMFTLSNSHDGWVFGNNDISGEKWGIYDGFWVTGGTPTQGTSGLVITNNVIHDIRWYYAISDTDLHAIGAQATCNSIISENHIYNTDGTAIDFFAGGLSETNNTISKNYIHDIGGTSGISTPADAISFDAGNQAIGTMTGNSIIGNIIYRVNIGGTFAWNAIGALCPDPITIENNTIAFCGTGIGTDAQTHPNQAAVQNNIIFSPTNTFIQNAGTGTATGTVDYNLCFTNSPIGTPFSFSPSRSHDTHSVFAYPLLVSASPAIATDFQPRVESPAIGAGTPVGISTDFGGNAFLNPPAIGAWEKTGVPTRTMYIGTLNLPH